MFQDLPPCKGDGLDLIPPRTLTEALTIAQSMAVTAQAAAIDHPLDPGALAVSITSYAFYGYLIQSSRYPPQIGRKDFHAFNLLRMLVVHRREVENDYRAVEAEKRAEQRLMNAKLQIYIRHVLTALGENPDKVKDLS